MRIIEVVVGREVIYTPYKNCPQDQKEHGIITGVNSKHVFVQYDGDTFSKATDVEDLEYVKEWGSYYGT